MVNSEDSEQGRKAKRVLSALRSKMDEIDSLEEELEKKKTLEKRSPKRTQITLERLLVPSLKVLKENKKKKS